MTEVDGVSPQETGLGNSEGPSFPVGLLEWAGNRRWGVRRMFAGVAARPSGALIRTPLLERIRDWAEDVASDRHGTPRTLLLVGGPGNGKTEAVEDAIRALEWALALDGEVCAALAPQFNPRDGATVPRTASIDVGALGCARPLRLTVIQDASVGEGTASPAECLVADLERAAASDDNDILLACVNRGILDDALILATSRGSSTQSLLTSVVRSVEARVGAPQCWPLLTSPSVAVWPMDVESLFLKPESAPESDSPAEQMLALATASERWQSLGTCVAGESCPFCRSREMLAADSSRRALLRILRQYELAAGKRWNFRDLFSLFSFLLAGSPPDQRGGSTGPCDWAAQLREARDDPSSRNEGQHLVAPFMLVALQFQHALFNQWPRISRAQYRVALRELGLDEEKTLRGLGLFLSGAQRGSVPRTLKTELMALAQYLDPANANPDLDVDVSGKTSVKFREIDARFSQSVREGLDFVRRYQFLSATELDLLRRLAEADERLDHPDIRNRKPTTAAELQVLLRDVACRLVRRNLGVRHAVVRDVEIIGDFAMLVDKDDSLSYQAAKQVEALLNVDDKFIITLNNTFGEPSPPETRRVVLETSKQKVRPHKPSTTGRPRSDLRFLTIGTHTATQNIPLTYELFRAVREMQRGMLAASLPRTVRASLDAARARLAGRIVRDEEALDGAEMRIGIRTEHIAYENHQFRTHSEDDQ